MVNKTLSTQLYSARLTQQEERKDSKDMQGYLACGLIAFAGSITKCASLYSIFISSALVHYLTILCKHLCYIQAGDKQSDFLFPSSIFHLLVLTTMLNRRQAVPDSLAIRESMPLAGYPKNTRPACTPGTSRINPLPSCYGF